MSAPAPSPAVSPAADRADAIADFLRRCGFGDAALAPLPGDASTRRYARLHTGAGTSLMLMDAPPQMETAPCDPGWTPAQRRDAGYNALARLAAGRVDAFVAAAGHLRGLGLSAPEIVAFDAAAGLAVIEDLGEALFASRMIQGHAAAPHYRAAVEVLGRLHALPAPQSLPVPEADPWPLLTYDASALETGPKVFIDWWPTFSGMPAFSDAAVEVWRGLWAPIAARGAAGAQVFTHRDYHAENLLWLEGRSGLGRVGLLDFQDAVRGHRAWDLLSLLQDARREVEPDLEQAMLEHYLANYNVEDKALFLRDYEGLAALNTTRIIGVFARLATRDGKPRYRQFLPRLWRLLNRNLRHPDLAGLRAWFDRHVPLERAG